MREYETPFTLDTGIRQDRSSPRNAHQLVEARNFKCMPGSLRSLKNPRPKKYVRTYWPFPQMWRTSIGLFGATHEGLYEISADGTWTALITGLTPKGPWHCGDFKRYMMFVNGAERIIRVPGFGTYVRYGGQDVPIANSICNLNGQAIFGGVQDTWCCRRHEQIEDQSWVVWSQIGAISCCERRENDSGYQKMKWDGQVWGVKKLGNHVIVYGNNGVTALLPFDKGPYFKTKELSPYGILSPLAFCGDSKNHFFVDSRGFMWRINEEHAVTPLGYREKFQPLANSYPVLSYDNEKNEVYISTASQSYLWTPSGLSGPHDLGVSSVIGSPAESTLGEDVVMLAYEAGTAITQHEFVTDIIDLGYRAVKTLYWVTVGVDTDGTVEVAVDYRYNKNEAWTTSSYKPTSPEGVASVIFGGLEFRIRVRVTSPGAPFDVDYILIKWKGPDKRFKRGATVATAAQGGRS